MTEIPRLLRNTLRSGIGRGLPPSAFGPMSEG
jgi:hypothetical protein